MSRKNQVTSNQRRNQVFNSKSFKGQFKFHGLTSESTILTRCFNSKKSFPFQTKQWQRSLLHLVYESFPTIRNKKEKIQRQLEILLDKKPDIKKKLSEDNNIEPMQSLKEQLELIEKICIIVATNNNTYKTN